MLESCIIACFQWELFRLNDLVGYEAMLQRLLKEDCEVVVNKYEAYRTALTMEMEKRRGQRVMQQQ